MQAIPVETIKDVQNPECQLPFLRPDPDWRDQDTLRLELNGLGLVQVTFKVSNVPKTCAIPKKYALPVAAIHSFVQGTLEWHRSSPQNAWEKFDRPVIQVWSATLLPFLENAFQADNMLSSWTHPSFDLGWGLFVEGMTLLAHDVRQFGRTHVDPLSECAKRLHSRGQLAPILQGFAQTCYCRYF
jgi:hypothetical protein